METLLTTLALAAITAISIIAYRHPKGYAKLFKWICELILWAFLAIAGFAVGVGAAHQALTPYLQPEKAAEAAALIARSTPDPALTFLGTIVVWGYFAFLAVLPMILEHDPDEKIER